MAEFQDCAIGNCRARVPLAGPPVCGLHVGQVEPGVCVDSGDAQRRFIPATDPECPEAANEPLLHPRRALRWNRAVHEFGVPMC